LRDHREEIRRLVAEAPDEPTYCEFKQELGYRSKKEKGELVKDVSSFANIDLEVLGGYGYLIFGVAPSGEVVGVDDLPGDPPSELRKVVNGHLDRPILFEYLTCEVDDGGSPGGTARVAAVVVPDSRRRPHVVSRNISEQQGRKTTLWLREGEVWVRKTGGRELATAEDLDAMYEGKLRGLVEEATRPLREAVARLDRDVSDLRGMAPDLAFGFAVPDAEGTVAEGPPVAVLDGVINRKTWDEAKKLLHMAETRATASHPNNVAFSPSYPHLAGGGSSRDYAEYAVLLRRWMQKVRDLAILEFTLSNTGQIVAEDVEVVLEVPAALRPVEELPEQPEMPTNYMAGALPNPSALRFASKHNSPDALIGPEVGEAREPELGSGTVRVRWEVGRLYHGRPLTSHSDEDGVEGLLVSATACRRALEEEGKVRLPYTIHAANLRLPVRGSLVLKSPVAEAAEMSS
jgi:hypothetical protein